jgi:hypothetical protein
MLYLELTATIKFCKESSHYLNSIVFYINWNSASFTSDIVILFSCYSVILHSWALLSRHCFDWLIIFIVRAFSFPLFEAFEVLYVHTRLLLDHKGIYLPVLSDFHNDIIVYTTKV